MDTPRWLRRKRARRERFARAVDDGATHLDDQEFGEELELVSTLRRLGESNSPDQHSRERIADSITGPHTPEPVTPSQPAQPHPAPQESARPRPPRRERSRRGRPRPGTACALACAVVLGLVGLGGSLSAGSTPGDPLYQVKRAQEVSSLALTFDDEAKAAKHLELATVRLDELSALPDPPEPSYRVALTSFDREARSGVTGMTGVATSSAGDNLEELRGWTQRQASRLAAIRRAAPPLAAVRAAESEALLDRIDTRTSALADRLDCYQMTSGEADDLGELPTLGECAVSGSTPAPPPATGPGEQRNQPAPSRQDSPGREVTRYPSRASAIDQVDVSASTLSASTRAPLSPRRPVPVPPVSSEVPGPRLPNAGPRPPAMVEMPPLMPGLPEVRIGGQ